MSSGTAASYEERVRSFFRAAEEHKYSTSAPGVSSPSPERVGELATESLRQLPDQEELSDARLASAVAEVVVAHTLEDPDHAVWAGRVLAAQARREAAPRFSASVKEGLPAISEVVGSFVKRNADVLDATIRPERDGRFDFFSWKTLMRAYLRSKQGGEGGGPPVLVETPQYMFMRVAVGIHAHDDDLEGALRTYDVLSRGAASHATPTMFNAGTTTPQLASCFLMTPPSDSIEGVYEALRRCAMVSKFAGGIGINVTDVRAAGSVVASTGGVSNGLVKMLRVFDTTARYVDQGGGKRKGAIAAYLEPWHADVYDFLALKRPNGKDELRARDLFYALWVPDVFMRAVESDLPWHLFCPQDVPELCQTWGVEFDAAYESASRSGKQRRTVSARALWETIVDTQIETGGPYVMFKDACNAKSNHSHLGPLRCSNLCTEIVQHVAADEVAVCNLASVVLPSFLVGEGQRTEEAFFDWTEMGNVVRCLVRNLNKNIDHGFYPIEEARRSNTTHRPMGIGVQGLADVFHRMGWAFDGEEAKRFNRDVFESVYFHALDESVTRAEKEGCYDSYRGSKLSKGVLSPDAWSVPTVDDRHDWTTLRERLARFGARNSLLVAPMPTASTAHILGNTEAFEPATSNMYVRRVLSGEFVCVNRNLYRDLKQIGLWTERIRSQILENNGSVANVEEIPERIRRVYRTAWELPQKEIVNMAADRAPFVDQAQSMNLFFAKPTRSGLTGALFHAWKLGLKNGMYYCHSRPASGAAKVASMGRSSRTENGADEESGTTCTTDSSCESCSA